jgi:hypothetical protein
MRTHVGEAEAARGAIWPVTNPTGGSKESSRPTPKAKPHLWITRSFMGQRQGETAKDSVIGFISMMIPGTLEHIDTLMEPVTQKSNITGNVLQTFGVIKPQLAHPAMKLDDANPNDWKKFLAKYGVHIYCTNVSEKFTFHDKNALKIFDTYIGSIVKEKYAACWYDETMENSDLQLVRKTVEDTLDQRIHQTHCHYLTVVNQHMIHKDYKPLGVKLIADMYLDIVHKYNTQTWRTFQRENEKPTQDFMKTMHLHYLEILNLYAHTEKITDKRYKEMVHLLETSVRSFISVGVLPNSNQLAQAQKRDWISHNRDDFDHDYFGDSTVVIPSEARGDTDAEDLQLLENNAGSTDMLRKWT